MKSKKNLIISIIILFYSIIILCFIDKLIKLPKIYLTLIIIIGMWSVFIHIIVCIFSILKKKNKIDIISLSILLIAYLLNYLINTKVTIDVNKYFEIKENVRNAVIWNLKSQYPNCTITSDYDEKLNVVSSQYNSSFLINNGYIKQEELLDVDGKTYCDAFVKIKENNQLNNQNKCIVMYKVYLKCNDYIENGYENWDK